VALASGEVDSSPLSFVENPGFVGCSSMSTYKSEDKLTRSANFLGKKLIIWASRSFTDITTVLPRCRYALVRGVDTPKL